MNISPYPIHTKQTRCNNNVTLDNQKDFFRPILSNVSEPLQYNHENYMVDPHAIRMYQYDLERSSVSTRNTWTDLKKPVQQGFQHDYYTAQFNTSYPTNDHDVNVYLTRNPVNTRRDTLEKERNKEKQEFLSYQGGMLQQYTDIPLENTRKHKTEINSTNYIPMPRTMAIPKEHL